MTALVLGAGGFIGARLCARLRRRGRDVVGFSRGPAPVWAEKTGVRWIQADFADHERAAAAAAGCAAVYHLIGGASPAAADADPLGDMAALIDTVGFLERLRATGAAPRLAFVSSGGTVYGVPDRLPIGEDDPTRPISVYGANKLAIENHLRVHHHLYGLDYCVLRVANPYGEGQISRRRQGVVAAFLDAAARGEPLSIWGDGGVVRDYVHVDDVVDALIRAGESRRLTRRVLNIASGRGRSLNEVADAVEATVGRPLVRDHRPARPVDVRAVVLDVAAARDELGWEPTTPWDEGLARAWAWRSTKSAADS